MKKIIIIILVIVASVGIYYLFKPSEGSKVYFKDSQPSPINTAPMTDQQMSNTSSVKEFTVEGKNFSFNPSTINVKKGDHVKITFKDADGFHDLKIDGYNVATQRIKTGQESTVEFVADKTGSFEYYCSVGDHREEGMKGTLTVTE